MKKTFDELKAGFDNPVLFKRGGQKVVWRAQHPRFGQVVIKVYFGCDDRAEREVTISHRVRLGCVPTIHEVGLVAYEGQDTIYVVEQFIEGTNVREMLESGGRFGTLEAVSFLEQGFAFVGQLEELHVVHRDIKPENLIRTSEGVIFFLDFGIARALDLQSLTQTGAMLGPHTPGYAAPEQFSNFKRQIDSRADLFSLGVVAYECLTGSSPFSRNAEGILDILQRTATVTPASYQIPGDAEHLFMGLLSSLMGKSPSMRPKDARQATEWLGAVESTLKL